MTLTLYRRHKRTCPKFSKARREAQKKCNCKFWADGVLAGREVRVSLGTRDSKKRMKNCICGSLKKESSNVERLSLLPMHGRV